MTVTKGVWRRSWVSLDTFNVGNHHLALNLTLDFPVARVTFVSPGSRYRVDRDHRTKKLINPEELEAKMAVFLFPPPAGRELTPLPPSREPHKLDFQRVLALFQMTDSLLRIF